MESGHMLTFNPMVLTKCAFIVWQVCESEYGSACFVLSCSVFCLNLLLSFFLLWHTSMKILSWFKYQITCASQARASTHQNISQLDRCSGRHKTIYRLDISGPCSVCFPQGLPQHSYKSSLERRVFNFYFCREGNHSHN